MATTYDKASLVMIPSGYKDDKLYSIKPTDGSGDFTFSRDGAGASPATRVNASGLIEKGRENLLLQSNTFTNADWVKSNSSITANSIANPLDGAVNASTLTLDSGTLIKYLQQDIVQSGVYTYSVYLKYGTHQFVQFLVGSDANKYVNFDLVNGTLLSFNATIDAKIEAVGNDWYRCSFTYSTTTGNAIYAWAVDSLSSSRASNTSSTGNFYVYAAQLESGLVATDYIETTTAPVSAGLLGDMPRLDYSGGATCPSLLLEPSRVNSLQQSEYFEGGTWINNFVTLTANAAISPEGLQNAYNFVPTTDGVLNHRVYAGNYLLGTSTYSIFIKPNGHNYWALRESQTTGASIGFDFTDNSIITEYSTGGCTASNGKIEDYGNGWYRISGTFAFASATNQALGLYAAAPTWTSGDVESVAWAGDGVSGAYIFGAQLESGSYVSSYIPTYGSASTRGDDFNYLLNISGLIGQTEGTLFVEVQGFENGVLSRRLTISDGTTSNRVAIELDEIASRIRAYIVGGGANDGNLDIDGVDQTQNLKIGVVYNGSSIRMSVNGSTPTSLSTSVVTSGMNRMQFSTAGASTNKMFGKVKQSLLFPTALTDAELAALTA